MSNVKDLEQLQTIFKSRLSDSRDPATLILREIKYIENVLDIYAPRVPFSYGDLFAVRKAYEKHIVSGLKLMERYAPAKEGDEIALWSTGPSKPTEDQPTGEPDEIDFSKARKFKLVPPLDNEVDALNLASALYEYLQWLRTLNNPSTTELIADRVDLGVIWRMYGQHFPCETLDSWLQRFTHPDINLSMPPINVEAAATKNSNRLILIAILSYIQKRTGGAFPYEEYVKNRFGIKSYQSVKSRSKDMPTFESVRAEIDKMIKKMT